jgi:SAM-dependent methyltransferase
VLDDRTSPRTRAAYDTVAADYALLLRTELAGKPLDRALLATFAELVRSSGLGPVADLGCGPGRLTHHLHLLGVDTFGVDLSPGMVKVARRTYPHLVFAEGDLTDLDLVDDELGGILAWYSLIHTPPEELPKALAELHRVLAPGGHLLIAFQAGANEHVHRTEAYGHAVSLDSFRHAVDDVADLLAEAGLPVDTRVVREPSGSWEKDPQAYLLARKGSPA